MQADECFFIDDTKENIDTAKELGMGVHLLLGGERIEDLVF